MTVSRRLPLFLVAPIAACALLVTACGSDDTTAVSTTDSAATEAGATTTDQALATCASGEPAADAKPQWTFDGTTGKVAVTASTDNSGPKITPTTPFAVSSTQVHTLVPGTGPVVSQTATVKVCYEGVNGRDGKVFDSAYKNGQPADFPLNGVIPGFTKAIAGQKVGSNVAVAIAPADGYTSGMPDAGIQAGDTLIFEIKILSAS
ncbi:peptidylprolyl isomerase [Gordonia sp. TBRC 11910]|uniref:Peptidyl-prolyl cis-trans isomerase n=1 Tax=Gordonia asplenii TaxID=2725283 RepID=A0A848L473_9ACTN|nr:FKBP-type peptidyl-prolyl cis-trans isomerase [Gordonia asplenii]NMO03391.1 peptidylprolyl isomerase [Gordonia asplenii]